MHRTALALTLVLGSAVGCSRAAPPAQEQATTKAAAAVPEVEIATVAQQLKSGGWTAVDANGDGTRDQLGVVPGAILLTDSETYSPSTELPADKSRALVFYCANEHCGASHQAAHRAQVAGYTHVSVMPAGIAGWVKAGEPTARPTKA